MISDRKLIPRYVVAAAVPYVFLSFVLLTAILFVQQSERFAELALYAQLPFTLFTQIIIYLLPSVLVFTLPLAVLAGVTIGFSRMGSDSEIVAMRAAGVGTWTMLWPTLFIGVVVTAVATFMNLGEAPKSARILRRVALQTALSKLDSPVDPRTFTSEIPGYVIYVREGDKVKGVWGKVFIYAKQKDGSTRVLTAASGRIDSSGAKSELVLNDAVATLLPAAAASTGNQSQYVVERSAQIRVAIDMGRAAILARLRPAQAEPDEMSWRDLRRESLSATDSAADRNEAQRTLQKRLSLSVSPLVFALLGGALGLRVRRGGRSIGILLSLVIATLYYLISLLGEQLARLGTVSPVVGSWMATSTMLLLSIFFLIATRRHFSLLKMRFNAVKLPARNAAGRLPGFTALRHWGLFSLLDASLLRTLVTSFVASFLSLVAIVIIFTLFELWRSIISNHVGVATVTKYFLFMLPLVAVNIFPATMLIAVLITYALLAKRSEAIAWWASGQSVYRLMFSGLLFALTASAGVWLIQEKLMPGANIKQSSLRAKIKGGDLARVITPEGRQWLASAESNRLYSYEYDEQHGVLREPAVYDFDSQGTHLDRITTGEEGAWTTANVLSIKNAQTLSIHGLDVTREVGDHADIAHVDLPQVFKPTVDKPAQLSSTRLRDYVRSAKRRGMDVSALAVALQRKYAEPLGVIVMAFLGMPLAISFGRRGTILALCYAVGVSLAYWGFSGGFQQLGNHGLLPPAVAGWAPPIIFAAIGTYFLSRVRT